MKLNPIFKMNGTCRALLFAALALLSGGALKAQSGGNNFFDNSVNGINLGNASGGSATHNATHKNWAIFALSGGVTITDPSLGGYDVLGNVGMAGSGFLNMSVAWVSGSVYQMSTSSAPVLSGGALITNTGGFGPTVNDTYLTTAAANAGTASTAAAGLVAGPGVVVSGTTTFVKTSGAGWTNSDVGVPASPLANTTYVVNLANLILSNSILTLSGTSTTNYVFNVAQYMTLSNNAHINLTGALTAANVLFNVKSYTPQYDVTLSGGSSVRGIILSPTRNVKLTGLSQVDGEVIAKAVSLSGASKVLNPYVSP